MDADEQEFLQALEQGIDLFNARRFVAAYEVWQERWSVEGGEGADLLQGLLQLAVAFAKLADGSPRSAVKLFDRAEAKLATYTPEAYGLDIAAVLRSVRQWHQRAATLAAHPNEVSQAPLTLVRRS